MSEGPGPRGFLVAALLAGAFGLAELAPGAAAKAAAARGRKATIAWLDETGAKHEEAARDIQYGYYSRIYLRVPKEGKTYKDELREEAGIPLPGKFINFAKVDRIVLDWETDADSGADRLAIRIMLAGGGVETTTGASLAGAAHPTSPYLAFTVDGAQRRIDLRPLANAAERAGKPRLLSVLFAP